jgi:uncharacterized alkaline shock family protein YloU
MTSKEKAIELVNKMEKDFQYFASKEITKQHALIAVDLRLEIEYGKDSSEYWNEVKQEIEKL